MLAPALFFACSNNEKFKVAFNTGDSATSYTIEVKNGDLVSQPEDLEKENYTFGGWFEDSSCLIFWDFSTKKITSNTNIYAKWTENPKLTYSLIGGRTSQKSVQHTESLEGQTMTLLTSSQVEKVGWDFVEWNTKQDGTGTTCSQTINVTSDVTVYAIWQKKTSTDAVENAYLDTLAKISELEYMAELYKKQYGNALSSKSMTLAYIRSTKYNSLQWNFLAGTNLTTFDNFVNNTSKTLDLSTLKSLDYLEKTSDEKIDFVHMMATLNMFTTSSFTINSDLGGWGGDLVQLINEIKNATGSVNDLNNLAVSKLASTSSSFNINDVLADLDVVSIYSILKTENCSIAKAIDTYYNQTPLNRKQLFKTKVFGTASTIEELAPIIKSRIVGNQLIKILMNNYEIEYSTTHSDHLDACCFAFARYLLL